MLLSVSTLKWDGVILNQTQVLIAKTGFWLVLIVIYGPFGLMINFYFDNDKNNDDSKINYYNDKSKINNRICVKMQKWKANGR